MVGAPVIGLLAGILIAIVRRPRGSLAAGVTFCSQRVLQVAVASLGFQLTIGDAVRAGVGSLPVMVSTIAVCLLTAAVAGRALHVRASLRTLLGAGTAICGASAIAAVTPVIDAAAADVAYALTTVFVFNATAVIVFPLIGHALGMSQTGFGLFAGTAINDTSSVIAAGYAYGSVAARHGVVVKLTRALFIIPITVVLAVQRRRRGTAGRMPGVTHLVPWFLIAFVAASALVSVVTPSAPVRADLSTAAVFLTTVALAGIGLSTDVAALRRTGPRPLVLGAVLWLVVIATSLLVAAASGQR